jgi:protein-S-isoprenylcysteine O-methyltransferase Ste14
MIGSSFYWILLSLALYGALHSLLASLQAKALAVGWLGATGKRFYRIFFNIVGAVTFIPVLALVAVLPDARIYAIRSPWLFIALGLQALSVIGLLIAVSQTGLLAFLGLDALLPGNGQGAQPAQLVTGGLYRWVRHPIYTCGLLFIWLTPVMTWNGLAFNTGITLYFLVGIIFEERKLIKEFGAAYAEYRQRTPMLIPGLKVTKNPTRG